MDLKRVQHTLSGHNNLLGLLLNWKTSNESCDFLSSFPFSELTETLLPSPDTGMYDFQEELTRPRIEYENSTIDGLGGQVPLKGLVDCDSVHIGIVNEPNNLIRE